MSRAASKFKQQSTGGSNGSAPLPTSTNSSSPQSEDAQSLSESIERRVRATDRVASLFGEDMTVNQFNLHLSQVGENALTLAKAVENLQPLLRDENNTSLIQLYKTSNDRLESALSEQKQINKELRSRLSKLEASISSTSDALESNNKQLTSVATNLKDLASKVNNPRPLNAKDQQMIANGVSDEVMNSLTKNKSLETEREAWDKTVERMEKAKPAVTWAGVSAVSVGLLPLVATLGLLCLLGYVINTSFGVSGFYGWLSGFVTNPSEALYKRILGGIGWLVSIAIPGYFILLFIGWLNERYKQGSSVNLEWLHKIYKKVKPSD